MYPPLFSNTLLNLSRNLRKQRSLFSNSIRCFTSSSSLSNPAPDAGSTRGVMTAPKQDPALEHSVFVPQIKVDIFGTVSVAEEAIRGDLTKERVYRNVDGERHDDGRYQAFMKDIGDFIPDKRCFTDKVRTFAYGTDASFYRLNPKLVVKVINEEEIRRILPIAAKHQVPVTFRAAGTSLSGQAITDSVLLKISHTGNNFRNYTVHGDGSSITVEPGLIGGEVNRILKGYKDKNKLPVQYKIGPDPSSIDSCMIGGIVSNNSSGMCCGVSQNTYHTLSDMRIVFADGSVLDTADPVSRDAFLSSHKSLVDGVINLVKRVQKDRELVSLIRRKFSIKCTTGYSLNALVDFPISDPIEIIKRLMIGSEGTFGFISRATYNTVPEWPYKASAFIVFPHLEDACKASSILRDATSVDAVELFDRACLRECMLHDTMPTLVPDIDGADPMAAALLIECRGQTPEALAERIKEVNSVLKEGSLRFGNRVNNLKELDAYPFTEDAEVFNTYWDVRKGLIPMVGAARETGTSMLIEDVACPVHNLAAMTSDLIDMFQRYGYNDACCLGHALEGNLHLIFSQGFRTKEEVQRFSDMMSEMSYIVATKYSGSLKGEHGTGRNVASFVEMEWGTKAYELMWELKDLFDPLHILNPGVVLNRDPSSHVKSLKPSPPASDIVNRCIECGFCESNCPSRDLTLTPRQRITVYREIHRLRGLSNKTTQETERLKEFEEMFEYQGEQTCAADGMCQEKCPVKINTGELIKSLRVDALDSSTTANRLSVSLANNFGFMNTLVPPFLNMVSLTHRLLGSSTLSSISGALNRWSGNYIPTWNPYMPKGSSKLQQPAPVVPMEGKIPQKVVYVPACVTRMMGPAHGDQETASVHEKLLSLFKKANIEVVYPKGVSSLCCGMMFNTRGFKKAAQNKLDEMESAILEASENGKYPVVCDTSPCLYTIKSGLTNSKLRFSLYEPVTFVKLFMADKLEFKKVRDTVAVHVPCSSKKLGVEKNFLELAGKCAHEVVPSGVPCCGMAGDRGMRYPELTGSALQHMSYPADCKDGYSTSRTCEMSLSNHSGFNFRGLVYLLDEATSPKS
eukprot:g3006.t1